jgi:hypothetical protein
MRPRYSSFEPDMRTRYHGSGATTRQDRREQPLVGQGAPRGLPHLRPAAAVSFPLSAIRLAERDLKLKAES